ncbi:MAG: glycosyltransferase family 9 protein [Vibrionaceae bacterium]
MKLRRLQISAPFACFEKGAYLSCKARKYLSTQFDPQKITKIAVIRHAALGDQVITRPFLIEARRFFPNATITLVSVSNYQYGTPADLVDNVLVMHGNDKKNLTLQEKLSNIKQAGEQEIIFDLAGTNRSYWFTALTRAKLKFGFPYKSWLRGTLYNACVFRSDFQPEVEVMLDMLRFLGHTPQERLDFADPDNAQLKRSEKPYILYFNGASQPRKVLTNAQIQQLLEEAIVKFPHFEHVFLEGVAPSEKGEFLQSLTTHKNFSIQPCMPLEQLVEYSAGATLVVSPDTGVRNVAIATHTPTVGIFFATVPFRYTPRYELIHHIVMNANASVPSAAQILASMEHALSVQAQPSPTIN